LKLVKSKPNLSASYLSFFLSLWFESFDLLFIFSIFFFFVRNAEESDYILNDEEAEKKFDFNLQESLAHARQAQLLKGMTFFVTNKVKPPRKEMKEIIEAAGGETLEKAPKDGSDGTIAIGCDDDADVCRKLLKSGVAVHTVEFLLSGVVRQKLDHDSHLWKK
jgi:hypothetical protein